MKFNFENLGRKANDKIKKVAKIGLIAGAGLVMSNQAEAQDNKTVKLVDRDNIELSQKPFLDTLKAYNIVDEKLTQKDFEKLEKDQLDILVAKYVELTKRKTRKDLKPGQTYEVISRVSYGIKENKQEDETVKSIQENFDFDKWFAEQIKLGYEGQERMTPDGRNILITRDMNKKSNSDTSSIGMSKPVVKKSTGSSEQVASTDSDNFILLKDKYKNE